MRAGLSNPTQTQFVDDDGPLMAHVVPLGKPVRGLDKLAHMGARAITECLIGIDRSEWHRIPLLLCVAETTRPGRLAGLDDHLLDAIRSLLGTLFAGESGVIAHGRVSVAAALRIARELLYQADAPAVLIAATDGLLSWPTLKVLSAQGRLLSEQNSNGFIPGEAASAVLVKRPSTNAGLYILGLGFATESASILTEAPLRADGLHQAIAKALLDADCAIDDLDFRITDISGEHYYFKEATLALQKTLRRRRAEFDIWHPAECIGEVGSAIGPAMLAVAAASGHKAYAPGRGLLIHAANDGGERVAAVARYEVR
jgi:3-oxoacyl-[acyl-carrier-protein] synthase-1